MHKYLNKKNLVLGLLILVSQISMARTLDSVKARDKLVCGVSKQIPGFAMVDDKNNWTGLDVALCQAVSVAIFNDPSKVSFVPLETKEKFTALQAGEVDVLIRNDTWTLTRNTGLGLEFTGIVLFDRQGFMVHKDSNITDIDTMDSGTICVENSSTAQEIVTAYFTDRPKVEILVLDNLKDLSNSYLTQRCTAITDNAILLAGYRSTYSNPLDHLILSKYISKDPFSPAVRQGDTQWANIIRWVIFGLINAEELGLTKDNVMGFVNSKNRNIRLFLGDEGNLYSNLALKNTAMLNVIKAVGNYGEVFENNLGKNSKLKLPRLENRLWSQGGLVYSPIFR